MLCQIEPSYQEYIIYQKIKGTKYKKKYIYARMIKAVYGTLLAAVIFYEKLSKHLREHGFTCNDYDMCTFNKIVNGNQLTVQFHVDDLKASHCDLEVLKEFVNQLRKEFGKEHKLSENVGNLHDYLGIRIDYSIKGKVVFTMFDYLKDIIVECPTNLKKATSIFPANDNLFKLNEDSPRLDSEKSNLFHQISARLLFAAKQERPNIQVCVAFLCTRVKDPHKDDYKA